MALNVMNSIGLCVLLAVCCSARLAEKVSEDDDFVVYRIPVRAIDLQPQETGLYGEASFGRSNSKSTSNSKSSSSSTGSGKGRGIGGGSSGTGEGYGSGGGGGGGGGHHFGGGHGGYGGSGGYGSGGYGSGGYGSGRDFSSGRDSSYTPGGYESGSHHGSGSYDSDHESPKVFTTTKTYTTNSAQNTGVSDPLGDINFRLSDYLKDAPGHEHSTKYSQKLYEGYGAANDFVGAQGAKINYGATDYGRGFGDSGYRGAPVPAGDFGRVLQGPSGYSSFSNPAAFVGQHPGGRFGGNTQVFGSFGSPSVHYPRAYALRHTGFGLGGGY